MANEDAKLFVAGLPDSISEDVLKQLFEATGGTVVQVSLPKDRMTGRPRGFGFVTLSTAAEAQAARDALDGSLQAGKSISVRPFQAEPPRRDGPPGSRPFGGGGPGGPGGGPGGGSGPRSSGGPPAPDRTLYVGNLPYDCTQQELETLVNAAAGDGTVVRIHMPMDAEGRKRGFGFVTLSSGDTAKAAAEALKTADMRGRRLVVNLAHPKGDRPPRSEGGGYGGGGGGYGGGGGGYGGGGGGYGGGGGGSFPPSGGPPPQRKTFDSDRRRKQGGGGGEGEGGPPKKGRGGGRGGRDDDERAGRGRDDWDDD